MTPKQARFLHISSVLVGATGIALFVFKDIVGGVQSEFISGPPSHPLEGKVGGAHILTAPALVFACALVWQDHAWTKFKSGARPRRRSGILLGSLLVPMIMSGYLLQVWREEPWDEVWRVTHLISSFLWLVGYGVHQLSRRGT